MISLFVVTEGPTEGTFVREVLSPFLWPASVHPVSICLYGIKPYSVVKKIAQDLMKEHVKHPMACTTMLDLYALKKDFPGYTPPGAITDPYARVRQIEEAFRADIGDRRFIPYIQLHEFEAVLFCDPSKFTISYPNAHDGVTKLTAVASGFCNPEHIDNDTPPSKRIHAAVPGYDKVAAGPIIASHIGLPAIRAKCPHFNDWLTSLENLAT